MMIVLHVHSKSITTITQEYILNVVCVSNVVWSTVKIHRLILWGIMALPPFPPTGEVGGTVTGLTSPFPAGSPAPRPVPAIVRG